MMFSDLHSNGKNIKGSDWALGNKIGCKLQSRVGEYYCVGKVSFCCSKQMSTFQNTHNQRWLCHSVFVVVQTSYGQLFTQH